MLFSGLWFWRYSNSISRLRLLPNGEMVRIEGRISKQPYQKGSKQIITIGAFTMQTDPFPRYSYGENLVVSGRLVSEVTKFSSPRLYLTDPSILQVDESKGEGVSVRFSLLHVLFDIRSKLMQNFMIFLPEPQASLLGGILLGVKRELPSRFFDALRSTGTLHVVVASGYNVTVIAGVIAYIVTSLLSRRWAIPAIIMGIIAYTLMAGAEPPVVRAAIMAGLSFMAQFLGKQYQGIWALFLASAIMLLVSPMLLFDVGFQLSVAATSGILLVTPVIMIILRRISKGQGRSAVEEVAVTLGAQLAVLPILLINFLEVSWLSPVTNLIVVFLIPVSMGMGGILAVISFVSLGLAQLFALTLWVPLTFFVSVVNWFERLPFGIFTVKSLSWKWAVGYYLVLGLLVAWFMMRWKKRFALRKSNT
jgi:competence protein ComEC